MFRAKIAPDNMVILKVFYVQVYENEKLPFETWSYQGREHFSSTHRDLHWDRLFFLLRHSELMFQKQVCEQCCIWYLRNGKYKRKRIQTDPKSFSHSVWICPCVIKIKLSQAQLVSVVHFVNEITSNKNSDKNLDICK